MAASSKMDGMEEDGKPQTMAGFKVGIVTPTTKSNRKLLSERRSKKTVERDNEMKSRVVSPPPLTPMAGVEIDNNNDQFVEKEEDRERTDRQYVYFPVELEIDKLVDWKLSAKVQGTNNNNDNNNNNNEASSELKKGALVKVNNTEVAVFKYGEEVLGKN